MSRWINIFRMLKWWHDLKVKHMWLSFWFLSGYFLPLTLGAFLGRLVSNFQMMSWAWRSLWCLWHWVSVMFFFLGRWLFFIICCPKPLWRLGPQSCGVTRKSWGSAGKLGPRMSHPPFNSCFLVICQEKLSDSVWGSLLLLRPGFALQTEACTSSPPLPVWLLHQDHESAVLIDIPRDLMPKVTVLLPFSSSESFWDHFIVH